jgi:hypothetical protein
LAATSPQKRSALGSSSPPQALSAAAVTTSVETANAVDRRKRSDRTFTTRQHCRTHIRRSGSTSAPVAMSEVS